VHPFLDLIQAQYSVDNASHGVLGGSPYSLTDEWWKADGSQRSPRAAYSTLANLYAN
jgi:hypothetical protein